VSIYPTVEETFFKAYRYSHKVNTISVYLSNSGRNIFLKKIYKVSKLYHKIHVTHILTLFVQSPNSVYSRLPISHALIIWLENYLCKHFFSHKFLATMNWLFIIFQCHIVLFTGWVQYQCWGGVVCSNRTLYRITWYFADTTACNFMCQTS